MKVAGVALSEGEGEEEQVVGFEGREGAGIKVCGWARS